MMTNTNKTLLIIGILILIFGFFISFFTLAGYFLFPIGGACIFIGLIVQKKYKGKY
jgi:1,4-dihydroxy-2-naphthoate octaprenyltransferase